MLVAADFLQGLRDKGSARRGCGNVLLWKDCKPNPRLVTKCRLRDAVSVPAAHLQPSQAWGLGDTSVLELLGSFPREETNTLQGGRNLLLALRGRGREGEASFGA